MSRLGSSLDLLSDVDLMQKCCFFSECATLEAPSEERKPSFLIPSEPFSSKTVLRGHVLEMECIAEGL